MESKARNQGSPVSSPSNPFSNGNDFNGQRDMQGDVDAVYADARDYLDGYGASAPVTNDAASGRPANPPSFPK